MPLSTLWEVDLGRKGPALLWWPGVLTLLLYAGFGILWSSVGSPAETLCALFGLGMVLGYGQGLRSSGPLWLLLAALLVQSLSWGLGAWHHPQWVADNPQLDRLAKLFIFIAVAWWLGGSTRNTLLVWALALVGYLVASLTHGEGLQEWWTGLQGQRVGFGIRNKQHGSMLFGVALVGVVLFARRFVMPDRSLVAWRFALWCAVAAMCMTGVLIGQTRAVWLATLAALVVAGAVWTLWRTWQGEGRRLLKPLAAALALVVVVATLAGVLFKAPLQARLATESAVVAHLLEGNAEVVPYTSIGIRIHSWRAALEWIAERPWVGWGGEGRGLVIDHTEWLPDHVKADFGHLHNFFLEVWVAYGLLGLLVIAALALWIGRGTWLAWRGGVMPNDVALFGAAFFVYWMVVNQFESYNSFGTGVYVYNLVVGGLVTHIWRWQRESGQRVFASLKPRRNP